MTATRADVVSVVKSWEGAQYGGSTHHKIIDIYNAKVGGMDYYSPWCAATASAAAIKAGAADHYPLGISCGRIIEKAKVMGIWVEDDSFTPTIGDWVIYDWSDGSNYAKYDNREGHDHIGTVVAVGDGSFTVMEGNMGSPSRVGRRTVKVNGRYIRGFVHPKFPEAKPRPLPTQPMSERANEMGLAYRAHVQNAGWLEPVHDGQIAGTVGYGARAEAVKITPPPGVVLDVNVHMQGKGWVSYPGVERGKYDPVMGTTGEGRRLEAIQIHARKVPEGKRLLYRAHVQGKGWLPWVGDGKVAGTTGQRRRLEAIQVAIVDK